MDPVNTIPAHSLMYQKADNSHSTRRKGDATQSAFGDYGFGPVNTGDHAKNSVKPVTGSLSQAVQQAMPWVAQVQAAATKA